MEIPIQQISVKGEAVSMPVAIFLSRWRANLADSCESAVIEHEEIE
jgi:hypothetical protein